MEEEYDLEFAPIRKSPCPWKNAHKHEEEVKANVID
jgi:hypothetical protein